MELFKMSKVHSYGYSITILSVVFNILFYTDSYKFHRNSNSCAVQKFSLINEHELNFRNMCFTKVFVTLLTLPWLNNAMNRHGIKMLSGNNTVFILYKTPPDRPHHQLWRVLEHIQQEIALHTVTCTPGDTGICIITNTVGLQQHIFNSFWINKSVIFYVCLSRASLLMRREEKPTRCHCMHFIALMICSTCFGHFYAHRQEL